MASTALEEKIEKIRLQNEKIRQRYEEVEADKKNAAKANALVQLVPSDDWPERKEPPEFSAPPKNIQKHKPTSKDHDRNDRTQHNERSQHYPGPVSGFGKKEHKFSQGGGPPPDPKYNFLADSEREMHITEYAESRGDEDKNRNRNKTPRGGSVRRRGGMTSSGGGTHKEAFFKDNRGSNAFYCKDDPLPEYEAWRAERNRIDEARINRQKTSDGNWRREWDSNKTNVEKDSFSKKGDYSRKDSSNFDRRSNHYDSDYSNRGHTGNRTFHGSQRNHGHQDYRRPQQDQYYDKRQSSDYKQSLSPTDERRMNTFDKNMQSPMNYDNQNKGPLMSVKVNSPSIAGTGRVGPRQKSRFTYSNQADNEFNSDISFEEVSNFTRQQSFEEKTASASSNSGQRSTPKSYFAQRKKEGNSKSPYLQRKEFKNDESSTRPRNPKTSHLNRNEFKDQKQSNQFSQKPQRTKRNQKSSESSITNAFNSDESMQLTINDSEQKSNHDDSNEMESISYQESYDINSGEYDEVEVQSASVLIDEENTLTNFVEAEHVHEEYLNLDTSYDVPAEMIETEIVDSVVGSDMYIQTDENCYNNLDETNEDKQKNLNFDVTNESKINLECSNSISGELDQCHQSSEIILNDEADVSTNLEEGNIPVEENFKLRDEEATKTYENEQKNDINITINDQKILNLTITDSNMLDLINSIELKEPENVEDYAIKAETYIRTENHDNIISNSSNIEIKENVADNKISGQESIKTEESLEDSEKKLVETSNDNINDTNDFNEEKVSVLENISPEPLKEKINEIAGNEIKENIRTNIESAPVTENSESTSKELKNEPDQSCISEKKEENIIIPSEIELQEKSDDKEQNVTENKIEEIHLKTEDKNEDKVEPSRLDNIIDSTVSPIEKSDAEEQNVTENRNEEINLKTENENGDKVESSTLDNNIIVSTIAPIEKSDAEEQNVTENKNEEINLKTENENEDKVESSTLDNNIIDSTISLNETIDDSGFVDANEYFTTDHPNLNYIEFSKNNFESNTIKEKSNLEASKEEVDEKICTKNNEVVQSDLTNITKELSEKNSNNCDNISAQLDVTIHSIENINDKSENHEEHKNEKLENITKEVNVIENENENKNENEKLNPEQKPTEVKEENPVKISSEAIEELQ